jgi:predicted TIM-barrel fold metal-dependent hydrolase
MPRKSPEDDDRILPFPVAPVSNMEWMPSGITPKQRLAAKLIREETEARAKRHGMTRGQFLRTAAATATAFMVLNKINGVDQDGDAAAMPIRREHCDDLDAGRELLDRKLFVMDVQQHHVDSKRFPGTEFCFLAFTRELRQECLADGASAAIGDLQFVREVFINSETDVGVISGLPYGLPMGPDAMAATRDRVNRLAGSERALSQAIIDPKAPPGSMTSLDTFEYQVKTLGGRALKCYTYSYDGWFLDDEKIAYPMLEKAQQLGLRLVNVHKGLPATFAPGSEQSVRAIDFPKVVRDFPKLKFCAYHSGWFEPGTHPEGKEENSEFLEIVQAMPKKHRKRVYAEVGSTFAIKLLQGPDALAHYMGQLLKTFGSRNILWGTDSIWWGSPQFLIDAFKNLQIPAPMREKYGYPQLTEKAKRRILGENAARLYGVKPRKERCTINADALAQEQLAQGGPRPGRTLRWYGPQTRREFFAMWRREKQLAG